MSLIVDYSGSTPMSTLAAAVRSGYGNGSWNGNGIVTTSAPNSSRGLMVADNAVLNLGSFLGENVDPTSVLIRYTIPGDGNLDSQVDTADYRVYQSNYNHNPPSAGDYNYDGVVDGLDYGVWQAHYGQGLILTATVQNTSESLAEGGELTFAAQAHHTQTGDELTYVWSVTRDGSPLALPSSTPTDEQTLSFVAPDNGAYTATVTITSTVSGQSATAGLTADVWNVPPALTISGPTSVTAGSPYVLNLTSNDPGNDTIQQWNIDWGDGNVETISGNPSSASHVYAQGPNTYTIGATVTDEDGTYGANPITLDATYGSAGKVISSTITGWPNASVLQSDGKLVLVGGFDGPNGTTLGVVRLNADGTPDTGFGTNGLYSYSSASCGYGIALQSNGKLLISGTYQSGTKWKPIVLRLNTDGTPDTSFGVNNDGQAFPAWSSTLSGLALGVAVQSGGRVVAVGYRYSGSNADICLSGFTSSGIADATFGSSGQVITNLGGLDQACGLSILPGGQILVAGTTNFYGAGDFVLLKYGTDGALDTSFGNSGVVIADFGGAESAAAIAVQSNGAILLAGTRDDDLLLTRFNADGSVDTGFGAGGAAVTNLGGGESFAGLTIQANGKIVVAASTDAQGTSDFALVRYNADGTIYAGYDIQNLGAGSDDWAGAVALLTGGKVLVTGQSDGYLATCRYAFDQPLVTTVDVAAPPPAAPTNLQATPAGSSQVDLEWVNNAASATGVEIERATHADFTDAMVLATLAPTASTYSDTGVPGAPAVHYYRVTTVNGTLVSDHSNTASAAIVETGQGLQGQYFNTTDLSGTAGAGRLDPTVNFTWTGSSPISCLGSTNFSVRWTGQVKAEYTETYTFYVNSDDGVRLYVNNMQTPLINHWDDHSATEYSATIPLVAGEKYDIRLEYYQRNGASVVHLKWSSPSVAKAVIPQAALFAPSGVVTPAAPADLKAIARQDGTIDLSWSASPYATSYTVQRFDGDGHLHTWTGVTGTGLTDNASLVVGGTYYYKVIAIGYSTGGTSNTAVAVAAAPMPTVPTNLAAALQGSSAGLTWNAVTGATAYAIYRGTGGTGSEAPAPYAVTGPNASFTDTALASGVTYYYKVSAINGDRESNLSAEASVQNSGSVQQGTTPTDDHYLGNLSIDSDNTSDGLPDGTLAEGSVEDIEGTSGKIIIVNDGDKDRDGVPDFADGYTGSSGGTNASERLVPLVLTLDSSVSLNALISFDYFGSNPANVSVLGQDNAGYVPASGSLRIWTKQGAGRTAGDYVTPNTDYSAADLGFTSENHTVTFYVEAVRPSAQLGDQVITALIKADGQSTSTAATMDAVKVTAVKDQAGAVASSGAVHLGDGTVGLSAADLASGGFGGAWGQSRTYTDAVGLALNSLDGAGFQSGLPQLIQGTSTVIVVSGGSATYFDFDGTNYLARFDTHASLAKASLGGGQYEYVLTEADGSQWRFCDTTEGLPQYQRGAFKSYTDAAGNVTAVTQYLADGRIGTITRGTEDPSGGETFVFGYYGDGAATGAGLLASVTWKRPVFQSSQQVGTQTLRQVTYTYYGESETYGNVGDLKTAVVTDGFGSHLDTTYYRYYTSGNGAGKIRMVVGSAGYVRAGSSVETMSNEALEPYADYKFVYDGQGRVTDQYIKGAGATAQDGNTAGHYAYAYTPAAQDLTGFSAWEMKTVVTAPSGNQTTVYTNFAGQTILTVTSDGANQAIRSFTEHDGQGRVTMVANSAAIASVNDSLTDLLGKSGGNYAGLYDSSGAVLHYTYYTAGPVGYLYETSLSNGETTTRIKQSTLTYTSHEDVSSGVTVFLLLSSTVYESDTGGGSGAVATTYSYPTWLHSMPTSIVTTLPAVTTDRDGSGTSVQTTGVYDSWGHLIWSRDANGSISYLAYDVATGAVTKTISDVNTAKTGDFASLPSGWTTKAGYGTHVVTSAVVDSLGRTVLTVDPLQHVTAYYYGVSDTQTVIETFPTLGPAASVVVNLDDGTTETTTFTGADPTNRQTWSRTVSHSDLGGRTTSVDDYSSATELLTTQYAYDDAGRAYRTEGADGTITQSQYDLLGRTVATYLVSPTDVAVLTAAFSYDSSSNLLTSTTYANGAGGASYTATNTYDWRNRLITSTGADGVTAAYTYDNFGRTTQVDTYTAANVLSSRTQNRYDQRGRLYQTTTYEVSPTDTTGQGLVGSYYSGTAFNSLVLTRTDAGVSFNWGSGSPDSHLPADGFSVRWVGDVIIPEGQGGQYQFAVDSDDGVRLYVDDMQTPVINHWSDHGATTDTSPTITLSAGKHRICLEYYENGGLAQVNLKWRLGTTGAFTVIPSSQLAGPAAGEIGDSLSTRYWYDAGGQLVKTRSPAGAFSKTAYDGLGRVTATYVSYDAGESNTNYAAALTVAGDTVIEQTNYTYDLAGNLLQATNAERLSTATVTGDLSASGAISQTLRTTSAWWFDALGRVTTAAAYGDNVGETFAWSSIAPTRGNPDGGAVTQYTYDAAGRLAMTTDNKGHQAVTGYDWLGRTTVVIENYDDGEVTAGDTDRDRFTDYTYDAYGRLSSVTAVNGTATGVQDQTTLYYYADTDSDSNNDNTVLLRSTVTETAYPDSTGTSDRVASTYDNLGRLLTTTDQRNLVHTYTYDAAGRLATDSIGTAPLMRGGVDGAVRTITYGYDAVGRTNLVTSLDVFGAVVNQVAYTYDGWGNLASEQQSHSGAVTSQTPAVRYTYDDGASAGQARYDRLASVTYPDGRQVFYRYGTTPATATRVDAVTNGAVTGTTDYEAYTYFGLSTVVLVNRPLVSGGMQLALWTGSGAIGDQLGRTSDTKWTNAGGTTVFDWFSYGYDANSNMLYRKNNLDAAMSELYQENNADTSDAYDGLDRLVAFSRGTLSSDNRSTTSPSRTQSWNLDGQDNWASVTTNSTTQDLDHNAANEITSSGFTYDAAGNLTSDGTYTYTYDGWNRLVKVETVGGTPETVATYAYDGQNHRVSKTAGGVTTEYYYDAAWRVVEERQGGQTTAEYIYGLQTPDVPIARIANGQTLFYCTDATGKVTSLVDGATHTVVERYVYDPYGAVTFLAADWSLQEVSGHAAGTASVVGNAVLYAGYRYDAETGLYNLRHREYHPALGRFLERDPVGYSAGSMNLYAYAKANPIGRSDPMGLCPPEDESKTGAAKGGYVFANDFDKVRQFFGGHVKFVPVPGKPGMFQVVPDDEGWDYFWNKYNGATDFKRALAQGMFNDEQVREGFDAIWAAANDQVNADRRARHASAPPGPYSNDPNTSGWTLGRDGKLHRAIPYGSGSIVQESSDGGRTAQPYNYIPGDVQAVMNAYATALAVDAAVGAAAVTALVAIEVAPEAVAVVVVVWRWAATHPEQVQYAEGFAVGVYEGMGNSPPPPIKIMGPFDSGRATGRVVGIFIRTLAPNR